MDNKPLIVVSAIRYFQGGTIVMVDECLEYLSKHLSGNYQIKALIYKKEKYIHREGIEFIEFPKVRHSLYYRLYYEYFFFKKLSKKWKPFLWLSMQDSTPNVIAEKQAVYFHNPLLQYKNPLELFRSQARLGVLWLLYKWVYTRGICKNKLVIVQQKNMSQLLLQKLHLSKEKLLIFPPSIKPYTITKAEQNPRYTFIYPATALAFKNFQVIFEACKIVNKTNVQYRIFLTVNGNENSYLRSLKKECACPQIEYKGFLKREDVYKLYNQSDCMIFPSLTETWGLPLSEFALQHKPIIGADLPYAKETLANYDKVKFFDPHNTEMLAALMLQAMSNELVYDKNEFHYSEPVIHSWKEMFDRILEPV